ncbi:MAG: Xaa-Pro peptidase family protein [Desulfobulbaceae bacterium]|nr:Xaa-Pro peptidase family protein [Desulfobulbaceae bacterium]
MDNIPLLELKSRWNNCRHLLKMHLPDVEGLLIFSRLNIYYMTGTFGNGVFWLPLSGNPILLCRRGLERAGLESPVKDCYAFRGYGDIQGILKNAGSALPKSLAVEMNGLSWTLGNSLVKHLPDKNLFPGDRIISMARAVKSDLELSIIRKAGIQHDRCFRQLLPAQLSAGMTERNISHAIWKIFFELGHQGLLRMENYGEEVFLGHIAAGNNGNYPSVFNGPVGLRGEHPAVPHMGSNETVWQQNTPLTCDVGFMLAGYHTDKTQAYWLGEKKDIPENVNSAHNFCIEMQEWIRQHLKPGTLPSSIWEHCLSWAQKEGWNEGFMALGGNKVNFVGHGIGLAIDEYPVLAKGFDLPLEEKMVLAVEPKIGIPGIGMVGVENTFEVTASGGKCLTGEEYDILCIPG